MQTRKRGHSAIGGTCYRLALAATSRFPGKDGLPREFDYTRRHGVDARGCELPAGADESWRAPLTWAHRIEAVDYRSNSRQFRDDVLGIPREMVEAGQAETTVAAYAQRIAKKWRTPVHWVIHDLHGPNPHAHVIYAGRALDGPLAFARKRDREQDQVSDPERKRRSITELHSQFWIETAAEFGYKLDFIPQGERAQKHIGPKAWNKEKKAITQEVADRIAETLDAADPLDAGDLLKVAHEATADLSVTEALNMEREPVTEFFSQAVALAHESVTEHVTEYGKPFTVRVGPELNAPTPELASDRPIDEGPEPIIVPDRWLPAPTPTIAAALAPPALEFAEDRPFDQAPEPALVPEAELRPPAPELASDRPIGEGPEPIIVPDRWLPAPTPTIAAALAPPAPELAEDRPFDTGPEPALTAALPPPTPELREDRPFAQAPAPVITLCPALPPPVPVIALVLAPPVPELRADRPFDQTPEPVLAAEESLPPPAPLIAQALPIPRHIQEEKRLKDAQAFEKEKQAAHERAARDRLTGALTADAAEAAGEALIRNHAGDASAYAFIQGLGQRANRAALAELRRHVKRHHVAERDRRKPGMTGRDYKRYLDAVETAINSWFGWRRWWRKKAARLIPEMIRAVWPVHWQETEDHNRKQAEEAEAARKAQRARERQARGLDQYRPRIVETPPQRKGRKQEPGGYGQGGGFER